MDHYARTETAVSGGAQPRNHDLVLAANSLVAGATYAFQLTASLDNATDNGRSTVTVVSVSPPTSGKAFVAPTVGVALETAFEL